MISVSGHPGQGADIGFGLEAAPDGTYRLWIQDQCAWAPGRISVTLTDAQRRELIRVLEEKAPAEAPAEAASSEADLDDRHQFTQSGVKAQAVPKASLGRCHVCGMPIGPGQESRECLYCDRIGHEQCGAYLTDGGPDDWCCDVCWDDIAVDSEEADAHVL